MPAFGTWCVITQSSGPSSKLVQADRSLTGLSWGDDTKEGGFMNERPDVSVWAIGIVTCCSLSLGCDSSSRVISDPWKLEEQSPDAEPDSTNDIGAHEANEHPDTIDIENHTMHRIDDQSEDYYSIYWTHSMESRFERDLFLEHLDGTLVFQFEHEMFQQTESLHAFECYRRVGGQSWPRGQYVVEGKYSILCGIDKWVVRWDRNYYANTMKPFEDRCSGEGSCPAEIIVSSSSSEEPIMRLDSEILFNEEGRHYVWRIR